MTYAFCHSGAHFRQLNVVGLNDGRNNPEKNVCAAQPFMVERAALRAQLIFFPALLMNKGRNNGSKKTF
jgi:hypothetical protein